MSHNRRFAGWERKKIAISGTGTSSSTVALLPATADRTPCIVKAKIVATPNDALVFYNGSNVMKTYPADNRGIIEVKDWGPNVDSPALTYPFASNMSFGYRMSCAASTAWVGDIECGWAFR